MKNQDVHEPEYLAQSPSLQPLTNYKQRNQNCALRKHKNKKKALAVTSILDNSHFGIVI